MQVSQSRTRNDLPGNRALRRDVQLLELAYGAHRVSWAIGGQWLRLHQWVLPTRPNRYNHATTDVLIMVPSAYGEASGTGTGLEEFYVRPDLLVQSGNSWADLPHSYSTVDRQGGKALLKGWRYLCLHTDWNARRDNVMTAMTQLGLVFADPWAFSRLADRNGA